LTFSGGVDGGRGWPGDAEIMLLDVKEIKALGWEPGLNSGSGVEKAAHELDAWFMSVCSRSSITLV
jgi:hypothetical protein